MQLFEDRGRISGALMRTTSPWLAKSWTNGLPASGFGGPVAQDPLRSIQKNDRKVRNQLEWWWMDSSNFPKLVDYCSLLYNIYIYHIYITYIYICIGFIYSWNTMHYHGTFKYWLIPFEHQKCLAGKSLKPWRFCGDPRAFLFGKWSTLW